MSKISDYEELRIVQADKRRVEAELADLRNDNARLRVALEEIVGLSKLNNQNSNIYMRMNWVGNTANEALKGE